MAITRNRSTPRSPLIQQLQVRCVERLGHRFRQMLDHIDDVFFDLADGASSSDHQNEYFQAMRELRMQRETLETLFRLSINDAFLPPENTAPPAETDTDWRTPVDIKVAVEEMAARSRNQHPAALLQLETRFRILMPEVAENTDYPLAPERICRAFVASLQILDISPNPQLVLLKHFEREVLPEVAPLLRDGLEIMRAIRTHESPYRPATEPAKPTVVNTPMPADFMQRLDILQKQVLNAEYNATPDEQERWRHQIRQSAQTARQENTINAVFMLFDFLLERQELSQPLAAAFARLQIPIIRNALQDPRFIRDAGHPTRRLLKTLAHTALRRKKSTPARDPLARALDAAIQHILRVDNVLNEEQCRQIENDFLTAIGGQEVPAKPSNHARSWDAAPYDSGLAKPLVDHLLQNRLQGKTVPEAFVDFMGGPWTTWLCYCREAHGNASPAWQDALKMTDELIWSVQPHRDETSYLRWMKGLPTLVKNVTDVLGQKLPPVQRDGAIESLWLMHAALLKSDPQLRFVTLDFAPAEATHPIPQI